MDSAPLPMRGGVAPSRVYLPPGPWATVLDFLQERFKYMKPDILRQRLDRGEIVDAAGIAQSALSPYQSLRWLWYYREVPLEAAVPFELTVLHRDERLLVVDKPHFLACVPGGQYLHETALSRLRSRFDLPHLSPVHRLDRDTAGVMLFCADPGSRGAYQALFRSRQVEKEYEAIAPLRTPACWPCVHRSRLVAEPGCFTMREVAGEPNSETYIELIARVPCAPMRVGMGGSADTRPAAAVSRPDSDCATLDGLGHYRLRPRTGRKHQLRVHMSALGIPICNDRFYPELQAYQLPDDFTCPLQLLARAIEFVDPFSGLLRRFESLRRLAGAPGG
jgi:tRNA pseudouridine32 synthase/23S rRNA pseudouridine746 synthase